MNIINIAPIFCLWRTLSFLPDERARQLLLCTGSDYVTPFSLLCCCSYCLWQLLQKLELLHLMRTSHCYREFQWTPRKQHPYPTFKWDIFRFTGGSIWKNPQIWALGCVPSHLVWSSNISMLYEMTGATLCPNCLAQCELFDCRLLVLFSPFYLKTHFHLWYRNIKICFTSKMYAILKMNLAWVFYTIPFALLRFHLQVKMTHSILT